MTDPNEPEGNHSTKAQDGEVEGKAGAESGAGWLQQAVGSARLAEAEEEGEEAKGAQAEGEAEALQEELEQLRAQAQEYLDGWQRARAELANARRRFEKERAEAGQYANAELIRRLLPVSDDFERALAAVPGGACEQSWAEGLSLIYRKLQSTFESVGVQLIEVRPGDMFDPAVHEALTHEEAGDHQSGEIIAEVQKGYRLGENVLRPALVRVAK